MLNAVGSVAGSLFSRGLDSIDITNGLFGSLVAITGDAHQAQVAQDIFRQQVRIDRSLRIREDIRDAHKLMIENVQTQLLMGNIVLGVCFSVLVEGRPSDPDKAPVLVQQLWAVFSVWSISLTFISVWFALRFQEIVSNMARKRLLEKHRICMPNDEVVGRMGGLSLVEQVARFHQLGLNQLTNVLTDGSPEDATKLARLYQDPTKLARSWFACGGESKGKEAEVKNVDGEKLDLNHRLALFQASLLASCQPQVKPCSVCNKVPSKCTCYQPLDDTPAVMPLTQSHDMKDDRERATSELGPCVHKVPSTNSIPSEHLGGNSVVCDLDQGPQFKIESTLDTKDIVYDDNAGEDLSPRQRARVSRNNATHNDTQSLWDGSRRGDELARENVIRDAGVLQELEPSLTIEATFATKRGQMARTVRAGRGTRAWYDNENGELSEDVIVDLPDFLIDSALICSDWILQPKEKLRMHVQGAATIYVAAQWPPPEITFRRIGPPPRWADEHLPQLTKGACKMKCDDGKTRLVKFHRVEGFSIFVSRSKMELPIYRCALEDPDSTGWVEAEIAFTFPEPALAPIIIVRAGQVITSEEDYPVHEFLKELNEIQPLREHSMHYMSQGLMNLILGAFFAHLGRVLTDRPWPICRKEVIIILCALLPALFFSANSQNIMNSIFAVDLTSRTFNKIRAAINPGGNHDWLSHQHTPHSADRDSWENKSNAESHVSSPRASRVRNNEPKDASKSRFSGCPGLQFRPLGSSSLSKGCACTPGPAALNHDDYEITVSDDGQRRQQDCPGVSDLVTELEETPADLRTPTRSKNVEDAMISVSPRPPRPSSEVLRHGTESARPSVASVTFNSSAFGLRGKSRNANRCSFRMPSLTSGTHLSMFFYFVKILWLFSVAVLVIDASVGSASSAPQGGTQLIGDSCIDSNLWDVQSVAWPWPFFTPTAAALSSNGSLWVASDWLLCRFDMSTHEIQRFRLGTAARGLLAPRSGNDSMLMALNQTALHSLAIPNTSAGASGSPVQQGYLRGMTAFSQPLAQGIGKVLEMPASLNGAVLAAAAAPLPDANNNNLDMVAIAPSGGGVVLLAAADLANMSIGNSSSSPLAIAAHAPLSTKLASSVRALHLCTDRDSGCGAGQATLWAVTTEGTSGTVFLLSIGLESGQTLARLPWPKKGQGVGPLALAGNATHLVVVARCSTGSDVAPILLSATYSSLLAAGRLP